MVYICLQINQLTSLIIMKIVKWIPQILLVAAFLMAGIMKSFTPYADIVAQLPWVEDYSPAMIKTIGFLELLGALGLILPIIFKKLPFLVPVSAIGLAFTMVGAMFVHFNRGESIWVNLSLLALCVLVIWIRKDLFRKNWNN